MGDDVAIEVENPCPERSRRMSKLYRIGKAQERHDTPSAISEQACGMLGLRRAGAVGAVALGGRE